MNERGERVFVVRCECCGAKIHIDGKTRSIFYTEKEGMKKRSFEEAVQDVTSVPKRAAETFQRKLDEEESRKEDLEKLFDEAKKKAEENPDEKPPSIWDYD